MAAQLSAAASAAAAAAPAAVAAALSLPSGRRLRICIVSDFFYPRLGGVELHQYSLAQALLAQIVIVVTGAYDDEDGQRRQGVRLVPPTGSRSDRGRGRGTETGPPSRETAQSQCALHLSPHPHWLSVFPSASVREVYYCPVMSISQQASLPNLFSFFLLRSILLRERVELVHGRQSTSSLAHEAILHARTMGLACVFTDHSLFSFANAPAINLNKLMKFTLTDIQHVICVSHCSKENLCLRASTERVGHSQCSRHHEAHAVRGKRARHTEASRINRLPPRREGAGRRSGGIAFELPACASLLCNCFCVLPPFCVFAGFTIVVLSRLVYRKGMDLIINVIPLICARFPSVHFLIGGDGPKRVLLEEMREKFRAAGPGGDDRGGRARAGARGPHPRPPLPQLQPHRGVLHRDPRGGVLRPLRGLHARRRRARDPAEGTGRLRGAVRAALVDAVALAIAHVHAVAAGETFSALRGSRPSRCEAHV